VTFHCEYSFFSLLCSVIFTQKTNTAQSRFRIAPVQRGNINWIFESKGPKGPSILGFTPKIYRGQRGSKQLDSIPSMPSSASITQMACVKKWRLHVILGGGFNHLLFLHLPGEMITNDPIWRIFFRWVENTNYALIPMDVLTQYRSMELTDTFIKETQLKTA